MILLKYPVVIFNFVVPNIATKAISYYIFAIHEKCLLIIPFKLQTWYTSLRFLCVKYIHKRLCVLCVKFFILYL